MSTDAELNALVAEKVAGYSHVHPFGRGLAGWSKDAPRPTWASQLIPYYVNDPAAVIALLEKEGYWGVARFDGRRYEVTVEAKDGPCTATAPTFARAAVLALLAALAHPSPGPDAGK